MAKTGLDLAKEILERRDPPPSGSGFLDAVARLSFDSHDVRGCARLAAEALPGLDAEDPARPHLERVAALTCATKRDARYKMAEIFAACDAAVEACELSTPAPGR